MSRSRIEERKRGDKVTQESAGLSPIAGLNAECALSRASRSVKFHGDIRENSVRLIAVMHQLMQYLNSTTGVLSHNSVKRLCLFAINQTRHASVINSLLLSREF